MSDVVGPISVDGRSQGMLLPGTSDVSEHTQQLIDEEVRRIVEDAERETVALLGGERHRLEALARALLERETLDQPEAYEIAGVDLPTVDVAAQATASEPASR
jgi:cell division protease FtsH